MGAFTNMSAPECQSSGRQVFAFLDHNDEIATRQHGSTYVRMNAEGRGAILKVTLRKKPAKLWWIVPCLTDVKLLTDAITHEPSVFKFVRQDLRCNRQVAHCAVKAKGLS